MIKKIMLIVCLVSLFLVAGCQETQKSKSLTEVIKSQQAKDLSDSFVTTCDGYDRLTAMDLTPREIVIARRPGIEQTLYLSVVDKEGNAVSCKEPMKIVVENDGKLALECSSFGKFKPIAMKDGKVVVE
jgi:hypothetical protein